MIAKILISVGVFVYLVLIPYLEINHSHVFNPQWPPHARFHEVWQLATNMTFGVMALWLVWFKHEIRLAAGVSMAVMGGVLFAHGMQGHYGGDVLSGNVSKTVLGLELAAFIAICVLVMSVVAILLDARAVKKAEQLG